MAGMPRSGEFNCDATILLIPAPLPITWIDTIFFASKEDKSAFNSAAEDCCNVPRGNFQSKVQSRLFTGANHMLWPPRDIILPDRNSAPDKALAAGGIMAMTFHMGNYGEIGSQACRLAFEPDAEQAAGINDPIIHHLAAWLNPALRVTPTEVTSKLFWGAIDSIVQSRSAIDQVSSGDLVLAYLDEAGKHLVDKMQQALSRLAADLRKLASISDSTTTELFERHPKPFSRIMTLFFLRDTCADLMAYRHSLLTHADYVTAAILFAVREGWLGLPLSLRDMPGLQNAVAHRMAMIDHNLNNTGISLGNPPAGPTPLRTLLALQPNGWNKRQRDAALCLARECKWSECIQTKINLGKGDYRMVINGSGLQIQVAGDVKAVITEVDPEEILKRLAEITVPPNLENKLRKLLGT